MTPILLPFASQQPQTALAGVNLQRPWLQVLRSITFHKLRHDISLCSHAPIGNFPKEATVMTLWGQVEHYIQLWCTKMKVWDFNQLGDMFHLRLFGYTFCLALFFHTVTPKFVEIRHWIHPLFGGINTSLSQCLNSELLHVSMGRLWIPLISSLTACTQHVSCQKSDGLTIALEFKPKN